MLFQLRLSRNEGELFKRIMTTNVIKMMMITMKMMIKMVMMIKMMMIKMMMIQMICFSSANQISAQSAVSTPTAVDSG